MPAADAPTITKATISIGEDVSSLVTSDLPKLIGRADDLKKSVETWNFWYLVALAVAALVAFAVVFVNRGVIVRQQKLAAVQDEILRLKDGQLRNELHEKDLKLAEDLRAKDVEIGAANAQIAEASNKVTRLQRDAADAKAAQQRVEIELSKQQERAAIAERSLLELQERVRDRHVKTQQRDELIRLLSGKPKGGIVIKCENTAEAITFANEFAVILSASGWLPEQVDPIFRVGPTPFPKGIFILVHDMNKTPIRAVALGQALLAVKIPVKLVNDPDVEGVVLFVAGKE